MSKLPRELESPIDRYVLELCDTLLPIFHNIHFTPNGLTSLSLVTGLMAVNFIFRNNYLLGIICIWVSYLFDCMDGMFARKYNMVSKFGDYYDHIKDIAVGIMLFFVILSKFGKHGKLNILLLSLIVAGVNMVYICNYERYYVLLTGKRETGSLDFLSKTCVQHKKLDNIRKELHAYRYIGFSFSYVMMTIILLYLYCI